MKSEDDPGLGQSRSQWFAEPPLRGFQQRVEITESLYRGRSHFQQIEVLESVPFGRLLALDGAVQTTEKDEFTYHEMLVHPVLLAHPQPRRVLLIGGGDGGALRRILEHGVERATMVELDADVVEVSTRYLPRIAGSAFDDPRARLVIADGVKYLRELGEQVDAVLVDSTDPVGAAEALFSEAFYRSVHRVLADDGIFVTQSGSPLLMGAELTRAYQTLKQVFPLVRVYLAAVPSYPGTLWSFICASKGRDPMAVDVATLRQRLAERNISTRYYTPEGHRGLFALPPFVAEALDAEQPVELES